MTDIAPLKQGRNLTMTNIIELSTLNSQIFWKYFLYWKFTVQLWSGTCVLIKHYNSTVKIIVISNQQKRPDLQQYWNWWQSFLLNIHSKPNCVKLCHLTFNQKNKLFAAERTILARQKGSVQFKPNLGNIG